MQEENNIYEEEITLKVLILKVQEYVRELIKNWWILGLVCSLTIGYFLYKHFTHEVTYNAELRFVVEGQSGQGAGLQSLLGTFGIKRNGKINPYKIMEVGKSTKVLEELLGSRSANGQLIADRIIEAYDLNEKWTSELESYEGYKYNPEKKDIKDRKVIKRLSTFLWGVDDINGKIQFSFNEDNGLYTILSALNDEQLSSEISLIQYDLVRHFFEDKIFANQKKSAEILEIKADSLKMLRDLKMRQVAKFEDSNKNTIYKSSSVDASILRQEIQALNFAYGEVLKNYEMTDVNLKDIQPLFMEIDSPYLPLTPNFSSLVKNLVMGLIFGFFLAFGFIICRKIYRDIMSE